MSNDNIYFPEGTHKDELAKSIREWMVNTINFKDSKYLDTVWDLLDSINTGSVSSVTNLTTEDTLVYIDEFGYIQTAAGSLANALLY